MAGLSKAVFVLLAALGLVFSLVLVAGAEDIQTGSVVVPPADTQTTSDVLQPVYDSIDGNPTANPADIAALKSVIENAVLLGVLTPEQAIAMLDLVSWSTLTDAEALANATSLVITTLNDLVAGEIADPVAELTGLLNELATPAGTLVAIGKAGAPEEVLDQVTSLVAGGVPPGILVRITKEGLRNGVPIEVIMSQLDAIAEALLAGEDIAWGQLANEVTETGQYTYQDEEQNQNIAGNEEPEVEANTHAGNNKTKDDNPGKGQGKDKEKKNK